MYDDCLANFEAKRAEDPGLAKRAYRAIEAHPLLEAYEALGVINQLSADQLEQLQADASVNQLAPLTQ